MHSSMAVVCINCTRNDVRSLLRSYHRFHHSCYRLDFDGRTTERKESVNKIEATQQQSLSYVSIVERAYTVAVVAIAALGKEVCQRRGTMKSWLCVF